ncbi:MAG TPA: pseudouridine synthase [bacterium]|nr:pseudouridine synthase [bacterium]
MGKVRLQKYLAESGIGSRRECEMHIWEGRVKVNGKKVAEMGIKIDPEQDEVRFKDKIVRINYKVYYALNKPAGYVSTRRDINAPKMVTHLVPPEPPVYPVGRLDKDTEGLIILTNDGELTNKLTHPRNHVEKEYAVVCRPRFDDINLANAIRQMERGVLINGYLTKRTKLFNVNQDRNRIFFNIILKEGKKRQIRRMCHNVGLKVINLKRVRIGELKLGGLKKGEYKVLSKQDISKIFCKK